MATEEERERIEQEIRDHGTTWCRPDCQTFQPKEYRIQRLARGYPTEVVQNDPNMSHARR